jgi:hypothetical protein
MTIALPLLLFHTRAVKSEDAVAILVPSGDHATELMDPVIRASPPVWSKNKAEIGHF